MVATMTNLKTRPSTRTTTKPATSVLITSTSCMSPHSLQVLSSLTPGPPTVCFVTPPSCSLTSRIVPPPLPPHSKHKWWHPHYYAGAWCILWSDHSPSGMVQPCKPSNVLTLCDITQHCHIGLTMDSQTELALLVYLPTTATTSTSHNMTMGSESKRESVPQHQYPMPGSMLPHQAKQANNQTASMHTSSPALSPIMGRCLSSQNAQTVTPGRHRTQLLVALGSQDCSQPPSSVIADKTHDAQQATPPTQPNNPPSTEELLGIVHEHVLEDEKNSSNADVLLDRCKQWREVDPEVPIVLICPDGHIVGAQVMSSAIGSNETYM